MPHRDVPIFQSLTDLDFYKPNMMQLYHVLHPDVPAKFAFTNRTKEVRLADSIDIGRLREELEHVRTLRHSKEEIAFYRAQGLYSEEFLGFLAGLALPPIVAEAHDGALRIETDVAPIAEVSPWETITLSVVSELHFRTVAAESGHSLADVEHEGERRLRDKIAVLRAIGPVDFIEFGTRRRYSRTWQRKVVDILRHELPEMLCGTSNVALAREFDLRPIGTMAHELFMAYACIHGGTDEGLLRSHNKVLQDWEALYKDKLLIALTDTFGTGFFFRDFDPAQTGRWSGLRQDSGDAVEFLEKAISHYRHWGVDPREKTLVFSDGLDIGEICRIEQAVDRRIRSMYGWGTDLTNDMGFRTLSLVMKLVMASWRYATKLSDNPGKHMGPPAEVARAKRVFAYSGGVRSALNR